MSMIVVIARQYRRFVSSGCYIIIKKTKFDRKLLSCNNIQQSLFHSNNARCWFDCRQNQKTVFAQKERWLLRLGGGGDGDGGCYSHHSLSQFKRHSSSFVTKTITSSSSSISISSSIIRMTKKRRAPIPIANPTSLGVCCTQCRSLSSWIFIPEMLQDFSIWGGSGYLLNTFHNVTGAPYWSCFAMINILVRLTLFPVVIYGAHTAVKFAKVLPEVQFLITIFQKDMKELNRRKATTADRLSLMKLNLKSLHLIYKGYEVNPLNVLWSPLLQLPIFYYISVDLRKIVNGLDPTLAQNLVESKLLWIPDLTEPDPWFGLPIFCGMLLYGNVEVSMGQRNLMGSAASKANTAILLKDIFQSLAIFMPCFAANLPAGIQIYLATTFGFTMIQSELLRNALFRNFVGLPISSSSSSSSNIAADTTTTTTTTGTRTEQNQTNQTVTTTPPVEIPKYAKMFIRLQQLEYDAIKQRGDGPLLGVGVLKPNYQGSFVGTARPTTIKGSGRVALTSTPILSTAPTKRINTISNTQQVLSASASTDRIQSLSSQQQQKQQQHENKVIKDDLSSIAMENLPYGQLPFIHGVSAPLWQQQEQAPLFLSSEQAAVITGGKNSINRRSSDEEDNVFMNGTPPPPTTTTRHNRNNTLIQQQQQQEEGYITAKTGEALQEELIEKANRGEQPIPTRFVTSLSKTSGTQQQQQQQLNLKRFQNTKSSKGKKKMKKKKR